MTSRNFAIFLLGMALAACSGDKPATSPAAPAVATQEEPAAPSHVRAYELAEVMEVELVPANSYQHEEEYLCRMGAGMQVCKRKVMRNQAARTRLTVAENDAQPPRILSFPGGREADNMSIGQRICLVSLISASDSTDLPLVLSAYPSTTVDPDGIECWAKLKEPGV